MCRAKLLSACVAFNGREQDLSTGSLRTVRCVLRLSLPRQDAALSFKVQLQSLVGILPWSHGDRDVTEGTVRSDPVVLRLVVLGALVGVDLVMLLAERGLAVRALEREEVDQPAQRIRTLCSDIQHLHIGLQSRCFRGRGSWGSLSGHRRRCRGRSDCSGGSGGYGEE